MCVIIRPIVGAGEQLARALRLQPGITGTRVHRHIRQDQHQGLTPGAGLLRLIHEHRGDHRGGWAENETVYHRSFVLE